MQIQDQETNPMSKVKSTLRSDSFYSSEYSNTNYMVSKNFSPRNNKVELPAQLAKVKKYKEGASRKVRHKVFNLEPIKTESIQTDS